MPSIIVWIGKGTSRALWLDAEKKKKLISMVNKAKREEFVKEKSSGPRVNEISLTIWNCSSGE